MKAIKVWSRNWKGVLMTQEAYDALYLRMNTLDFHTHKKELVWVKGGLAALLQVNVLTVADIEAGKDKWE